MNEIGSVAPLRHLWRRHGPGRSTPITVRPAAWSLSTQPFRLPHCEAKFDPHAVDQNDRPLKSCTCPHSCAFVPLNGSSKIAHVQQALKSGHAKTVLRKMVCVNTSLRFGSTAILVLEVWVACCRGGLRTSAVPAMVNWLLNRALARIRPAQRENAALRRRPGVSLKRTLRDRSR